MSSAMFWINLTASADVPQRKTKRIVKQVYLNQTALCITTVVFQVVVASRDGGYADVLSEEGHGGILRGGVSVRGLLDATFAIHDFCAFTAAHGRFAAELLGGRGRSGHLSLIVSVSSLVPRTWGLGTRLLSIGQ